MTVLDYGFGGFALATLSLQWMIEALSSNDHTPWRRFGDVIASLGAGISAYRLFAAAIMIST